MPSDIRRHVRQDNVRLAKGVPWPDQQPLDLARRRFRHEVGVEGVHAGDALDGEQVHGDNPAAAGVVVLADVVYVERVEVREALWLRPAAHGLLRFPFHDRGIGIFGASKRAMFKLPLVFSLRRIRQYFRRRWLPPKFISDDLTPPSRRRTEINDGIDVRRVQKVVPVLVNLEKLERRARSVRRGVAEALLHVGVAELARGPRGGFGLGLLGERDEGLPKGHLHIKKSLVLRLGHLGRGNGSPGVGQECKAPKVDDKEKAEAVANQEQTPGWNVFLGLLEPNLDFDSVLVLVLSYPWLLRRLLFAQAISTLKPLDQMKSMKTKKRCSTSLWTWGTSNRRSFQAPRLTD